MFFLIVEKDMCAKGPQNWSLGVHTDEMSLIGRRPPRTKRVNDARMRGSVARGDYSYPNFTDPRRGHEDRT